MLSSNQGVKQEKTFRKIHVAVVTADKYLKGTVAGWLKKQVRLVGPTPEVKQFYWKPKSHPNEKKSLLSVRASVLITDIYAGP